MRFVSIGGNTRIRKSATSVKHARGVGMPGSDPHYRKNADQHITSSAKLRKRVFRSLLRGLTHKCRSVSTCSRWLAQLISASGGRCELGRSGKHVIDLTEEFEAMLLTYERREIENAYERHPLIDVPLDWKLLDELPQFNKSGGYHLPQLRHQQPMCRGYGIHESLFGAKSIELHNTLAAHGLARRRTSAGSSSTPNGTELPSWQLCSP